MVKDEGFMDDDEPIMTPEEEEAVKKELKDLGYL